MRIAAILAVSAAALLTCGASVPSSALIWERAPSFADMQAAWPAKTGDLIDGEAVLNCRVVRAGELANCETVRDIPAGKGFARQAKGLVGRFKLKIDMATLGRNSEYYVTVPFHFINPARPEGQVRKVTSPRWISMPDPGRIQAAYPKTAADAGVKTGVGVIDCATGADGRLTDCRVAREDPAGLGFGEAAMSVAPIMQMNPWTDDGRPVDGARIKLPIQFKLAGS